MEKVKKLWKAFSLILKKPYLLNLIINTNDNFKSEALKYHFGKGFPVINILDIVPDLNVSLENLSFLGGGSLLTDIALLKSIVKKYDEPNYFEIGTWRGESIVNVAQFCKNCYTLNLSEEELRSIGLSEDYIRQQDFFSKQNKNISHLKGNSINFDFSKYYKKIDVVFIDGDHHYESVKKDTETAFKLIKDEKSTIIWHDYAFQPDKIRYEVLSAIVAGTPEKYRNRLYHVSNTLCAIFTSNKYNTTGLDENKCPSVVFSVKLKAYPIKKKE